MPRILGVGLRGMHVGFIRFLPRATLKGRCAGIVLWVSDFGFEYPRRPATTGRFFLWAARSFAGPEQLPADFCVRHDVTPADFLRGERADFDEVFGLLVVQSDDLADISEAPDPLGLFWCR